ncbi:hypothetical protein S83_056173, partial [Arachis hypogaea]
IKTSFWIPKEKKKQEAWFGNPTEFHLFSLTRRCSSISTAGRRVFFSSICSPFT